MMTRRIGRVFVVVMACASMWQVAGCQKKVDPTLRVLREGNFRGSIVLQTGGQMGVGTATELYLGTRNTNLSAKGEVDFSIPPGSGPVDGNDPIDDAEAGGAGGPGVPPFTGEDD